MKQHVVRGAVTQQHNIVVFLETGKPSTWPPNTVVGFLAICVTWVFATQNEMLDAKSFTLNVILSVWDKLAL